MADDDLDSPNKITSQECIDCPSKEIHSFFDDKNYPEEDYFIKSMEVTNVHLHHSIKKQYP